MTFTEIITKQLEILNYNCQGINNIEKQAQLINYIIIKNYDAIVLTETKFTGLSLIYLRRRLIKMGFTFVAQRKDKAQVIVFLKGDTARYLVETEVSSNIVKIL